MGNVDSGQQIAYDGLLRAARIAASIAGATGVLVEEIADEAIARLLIQDGLVNNPRAWVRSTATRLAAQPDLRLRIRTDDVLAGLSRTERELVTGQRTGYTVRELARHVGLAEDVTLELLTEANRKVRRSGRRLDAVTH